MSKKIKLGSFITAMLLALLAVTACGGAGGEGVTLQYVTVERGDLTVSVTGSGKIGTSREARLAFGSGGKVDEVLVEDGDVVKEGDVLARLDKGALEVAYTQSKVALKQAEAALIQAQLARKTAESNLRNIRDSEDTLKVAVINAQVNLDQAQRSLKTSITAIDYRAAEANLRKAQEWYSYLLRGSKDFSSGEDYFLALERAKDNLDAARTQYDNILAGYDTQDINIKTNQVKAAEISLATAQKNLENLADDIELQELQLNATAISEEQAEQSVELAQQSLDDAQRQLDEATIVATFDGLAATVMAEAGDVIPSPTFTPQTIVYLVDPSQLELVVEVDEIDIPLVEEGSQAVITVDALPHDEFKGTVTAVYPVPKEVGGVVLYDVRLSLDNVAGSAIKVGMSASADIMIASASDTLLVPSRAVYENEQGEMAVKVSAGEQVDERVVTVGLDDGLRTEITSGLNEGETVVIEIRAR